jgi:hypothetical protein
VQKTIARGALLEQPYIRDTAKVCELNIVASCALCCLCALDFPSSGLMSRAAVCPCDTDCGRGGEGEHCCTGREDQRPPFRAVRRLHSATHTVCPSARLLLPAVLPASQSEGCLLLMCWQCCTASTSLNIPCIWLRIYNGFVRSFVLGEGIVKKEADLAAEVEEQTKSFEKKAAEKAAASVDAPAAEVVAEVADDAKPAVQVTLPALTTPAAPWNAITVAVLAEQLSAF